MSKIHKLFAVALLALVGLTSTSMFGSAHAYWERGSSGTNYQYNPDGSYTGNYGR
jgi:hypothetical protein